MHLFPAIIVLVLGIVSIVPHKPTNAFLQPRIKSHTNNPTRTSTDLFQSNQFDVSKPVFDLLSFRSIRGDAIVRYDATNQSEPLRIQLYAIFFLTFLAAPSLCDALGYDPLGTPGTIGSIVASLGSGGLLARECKRRSRQLDRIEKELNTQLLPIRLPTNALADRQFSKPVALGQLSSQRNPPRVIALCGTEEKLQKALEGLMIFGKRLEQASVFVVCIPLKDTFDPYKWVMEKQNNSGKIPWLADSYNNKIWRAYFDALSSSDDEGAMSTFRWFGLNSSGRSIGSGKDEIPMWLQLLGQHFRPTLDDFDLMETSTTSYEDGALALSEAVENFYGALTSGNQDIMKDIFSESVSSQVTEVVDAGGRLDVWTDCLAEGARPEGMKISAAEVVIMSDTEAYTTVVESPVNTGLETPTLLAIQKWNRSSPSDSEWKLTLHQTIPWDASTKAQGTLRCDCRGCVALTRAPERQTFGGLIG